MKNVKTAFVAHDLAKLITSCKHAYYTGADGVPDEEYDKLERWLTSLCPKHPILGVVGLPGETYKNPQIKEVMELMEITPEKSE